MIPSFDLTISWINHESKDSLNSLEYIVMCIVNLQKVPTLQRNGKVSKESKVSPPQKEVPTFSGAKLKAERTDIQTRLKSLPIRMHGW